MGRYVKLKTPIAIINGATVAGPFEGNGPLAEYIDVIYDDNSLGEPSWEKAERMMMESAANNVLIKSNVKPESVDLFFAGDLLNQIITSTFTARTLQIPFIGLYGACSTFVQGLVTASLILQNQDLSMALTATSSHNSTSERQFRYPTEYGVQLPPTAQYTVSGSGATLVSNKYNDGEIYITAVTVGNIVDLGIKNPYEMGAAMAPAAKETIKTHLKNDKGGIESYDGIFTGDLGKIGKALVNDMLKEDGIDIESIYNDCGTMIFDLEKQGVNSGGSGCACSAIVTLGYILNQFKDKIFNKVLVVSTGSLHSPTSYQQKETIPGVAHAICIERIRGLTR